MEYSSVYSAMTMIIGVHTSVPNKTILTERQNSCGTARERAESRNDTPASGGCLSADPRCEAELPQYRVISLLILTLAHLFKNKGYSLR